MTSTGTVVVFVACTKHLYLDPEMPCHTSCPLMPALLLTVAHVNVKDDAPVVTKTTTTDVKDGTPAVTKTTAAPVALKDDTPVLTKTQAVLF